MRNTGAPSSSLSETDDLSPPRGSPGDKAYAVLKLGLSIVPGANAAAELFTWISPPLERRRNEWMQDVVSRLHKLENETPERFAETVNSDLFASVCLDAAQAALRATDRHKRDALAAAVMNSARGVNIAGDLQTTFVRYVDELTPTHVEVLRTFAENEAVVMTSQGYPELLHLFRSKTGVACSEEEFCLFCSDLGARILLRLSAHLGGFSDLAEPVVLATEQSSTGPLARVTDLGKQFLVFVTDTDDAPTQR